MTKSAEIIVYQGANEAPAKRRSKTAAPPRAVYDHHGQLRCRIRAGRVLRGRTARRQYPQKITCTLCARSLPGANTLTGRFRSLGSTLATWAATLLRLAKPADGRTGPNGTETPAGRTGPTKILNLLWPRAPPTGFEV
jgi:hypothetical protein